jgi:hypothetical protein
MIINENEYGAPWNDQFYDVIFYFVLNLDDVKFISEQLTTSFCLSGPHEYEYSELKEYAYDKIHEDYKFDYDQIIILNINQH